MPFLFCRCFSALLDDLAEFAVFGKSAVEGLAVFKQAGAGDGDVLGGGVKERFARFNGGLAAARKHHGASFVTHGKAVQVKIVFVRQEGVLDGMLAPIRRCVGHFGKIQSERRGEKGEPNPAV